MRGKDSTAAAKAVGQSPLARGCALVAVGEVVWDVFPDREVLGGAPINVAYHLAALGRPVQVITRVGEDTLGAATLARLAELGLPLAGVQRDAELPTGRVLVSFDGRGEPAYDIVAPAAWDNIDADRALAVATGGVAGEPAAGGQEVTDYRLQAAGFALVFGTLAQRDPRSRAAVRQLAAAAEVGFYDVNLRPPYTTRELVLASLELADLVKVNAEELGQIGNWLELPGAGRHRGLEAGGEELAAALLTRYGLQALVVTEGGAGAWVRTPAATYHDVGESVQVVDTVGAGDAFFAALIAARQDGLDWPETLRRANRRGGYVASRHGATPPVPATL